MARLLLLVVFIVGFITGLAPGLQAEGRFGLPLWFEENRGQLEPSIRFVAYAAGYSAHLKAQEVILRAAARPIHIQFAGAEDGIRMEAADPLAARTDVYDSFRRQWVAGIRNYQRVTYREVYPGIDVLFRDAGGHLEFDFIVAAGADPDVIRLKFSGQDAVSVNEDGNITLTSGDDSFQLLAPVVYQERDGRRTEIAARYRPDGPDQVLLALDDYDPTRNVIIDPRIVFASYTGGSGEERTRGLELGPDGSAYVLFDVFDEQDKNAGSIWIVRYSAAGDVAFFYRTDNFFADERAIAMDVDAAGNVALLAVITEFFPGHRGHWTPSDNALQKTRAGAEDMILLRMGTNPFATYLGGNGTDIGTAVAFDPDGNIYVTGRTNSTDLATAGAYQPEPGGGADAFLIKLDPAGTRILHATYLGGAGEEQGNALAVDAAGNVFVAGITQSANFPVRQALDPTFGGGSCNTTSGARPCSDLFVARFNPAGAAAYATYIGGGGEDNVSHLTVTADGEALLVGRTESSDFPNSGSLFDSNIYLLKVSGPGDRLVFATRFAAAARPLQDAIPDIAVDDDENVYLAGSASGNDFPVVNSLQLSAGVDIYVARLNPSASAITFSTRIGGDVAFLPPADPPFAFNVGEAVAVDPLGRVFVVGLTNALDFPVTNGSQRSPLNLTSSSDPVLLVVESAADGDTTPRYTRLEQNYPQLTFTGQWFQNRSQIAGHSQRQAVTAMAAGASFSVTFTGTEVTWLGCRDPWSGIANVFLDDVQLEVDTYSADSACQVPLWSATGLASGPHTLRVEVAGRRNPTSAGNWIWIDAIDIVSAGDAQFGVDVGSDPGGGDPGNLLNFEQNHASIQYSSGWLQHTHPAHSGGNTFLAIDAGATATFHFAGTAVRWIGARDEWSGVANVYIDGVFQTEVDTFGAGFVPQSTLYSASGLSPGNHTLTIEVTGRAGPSGRSAWIWIDALQAAGPGDSEPPPDSGGDTFSRVEQDSPAVSLSSEWLTHSNSMHSGGSAALALDAGATATLVFNGTAVRWLGVSDPWSGIARVYVDGVLQGEIDTYAATPGLQHVLFAAEGLNSGSHNLVVEVTGRRNVAAASAWIWVDAFEYR